MKKRMKLRTVVDQDVSGLGAKIKQVRESDERSLTQICAAAKMTSANWYKIENEDTKLLPLETLRRIEAVLNVDLGVRIDAEKLFKSLTAKQAKELRDRLSELLGG